MNIIDNDLLSMQEARILVENAREAQKRLAAFSQEKLDAIVEHMSVAVESYAEELAKLSHEETEYGRWQDKCIKNRFVCRYLKERLRDMKCVGVIHEDKGAGTMDIGVPMGVIVALCPATSPVSTTIYKTLIAIKSGNAIIFSPHPRAKRTMARTLEILIQAGMESGLPDGVLSYLSTVTRSGCVELMGHPAVHMIMNTGVHGMLDAARSTGKPLIYGGPGNGPAFIERTADIRQSVSDIINSKTFDHGVLSASEQSIVVDACVDNEVRTTIKAMGGYFMSPEEAERLGMVLYLACGKINPEMIGKSAAFLAKKAGISVPEGTVILISEQRFMFEKNPYSREKLSPVMAYYVEDDWMHACEKCIELLLSEGLAHTLVIHSNDESVIRQFALKKPVGRMLVNTPATFGSMGATTSLFPSMTLGSGSSGQGITSDNVSPMNLIYIRKIGYGIRKVEQFLEGMSDGRCLVLNASTNPTEALGASQDSLLMLQQLIKKAIEELEHKSS